jgi:hypothetical protein
MSPLLAPDRARTSSSTVRNAAKTASSQVL